VRTLRILTIVGARPQFVKAAMVSKAIQKFNSEQSEIKIEEVIVHTGQHYDFGMSKVFFDELSIPEPAYNLRVGSGGHGVQTGEMMIRLERTILQQSEKFDFAIVYGDTNSTLVGALVASKLHIPVAHVEAGLRGYDRVIAEEINRVVTDYVSDLLFCPSETAVSNLGKENILGEICNVGDVMKDAALFYSRSTYSLTLDSFMKKYRLEPGSFYLATIHRAENTSSRGVLSGIRDALKLLEHPVILPMHPRTSKAICDYAITFSRPILIIEPVSYFDMLALEKNCRMVITDSGGVQKEAYWFGKPCVTMTDVDEWCELSAAGCNKVVGSDHSAIVQAVSEFEDACLFVDTSKSFYGDGHCAELIVDKLVRRMED